ncbi:hypothetical protein [Massilia phyllosphaerae]|uniref:hypothetical protein n=1 Tax=Massilia phyllosphaerae TaxID=3106034 RepID=UPI002B1CC4D2|nr:hypothetical protein [Massilia sp. SGZ-792]
MRTPTTRLLFPLLVLHCAAGFACAIVPPEKQAETHAKHLAAYKAEVAAVKEEADLIFMGSLSTLTSTPETVTLASGQSRVLQHHQAVFLPWEQIKGVYRDGQVLDYTTDKNRVMVGCGPAFRTLPKENGAGEVYLVYAREGRILRTNHIPMDAQVLSGYEEAAFLRGGE